MKVLVDENIPEAISILIPGHDVHHVKALGWQGIFNGKLMSLAAEHHFEAIITVDKNMAYQQNMLGRPFALVVLNVHPTTKVNIAACLSALNVQLLDIQPGQVYYIDGPKHNPQAR